MYGILYTVMSNKGNILIVDDDAMLRTLYLRKFGLGGFDIRIAANGQEALDLIAQQAPDLLILDVHMPVMDGFEVLRRVPQDQRKFPVILLTNFADEKTKEIGKQLGADDYFVKKDMTIRSLLEMAERVMSIRKYTK